MLVIFVNEQRSSRTGKRQSVLAITFGLKNSNRLGVGGIGVVEEAMSIRYHAGSCLQASPRWDKLNHVLSEWWQRQCSLHELETLDDSILRDIGLSRSDLRIETSKPFWLN
jgi:uncharacterized protein YjiS (DUF1127 family)